VGRVQASNGVLERRVAELEAYQRERDQQWQQWHIEQVHHQATLLWQQWMQQQQWPVQQTPFPQEPQS
jgi:hypothetical protein